MNILLYDIEISPMLAWTYDMYDARVVRVEREPVMMCFSYMWYDEGVIRNIALPDFTTQYKHNRYNDSSVVNALNAVLGEADIVCAHNAIGFDNKVANARFLYHGLTPPSPYRTVDTLKAARRYFKLGNNSLQSLCTRLGIGSKPVDTHADLWYECLENRDPRAWEKMRLYCNTDVMLLRGLYDKLRPYIANHPHVREGDGCPRCGSDKLVKRGYRHTNTQSYRRVRCSDCGAWSRERLRDKEVVPPKYTTIGG